MAYGNELNFNATELRLGLPGTEDHYEQALFTAKNNKKPFSDKFNEVGYDEKSAVQSNDDDDRRGESVPAAKAHTLGWPPIRSYIKNKIQTQKNDEEEGLGIFVKVSMDGAPYLRKIDLKICRGYQELLEALENMFENRFGEYSESEGYKGSGYVPTYEDKDGDWMLVGDVPWDMFIGSCKRLRIMRGSKAKGLGSGA